MAAKEINLLIREEEVSPEAKRARRSIKNWIQAAVISYLLIVAGIFIVALYLSNQREAVERAITSERARIRALARNEGAFLMLKQKAASISQILQARYPYVTDYEYLKQLESDGTRIHAVKLSESGTTEIEVAVNSSDALDQFISLLLGEADKRFKRVELRSFHSTNEGFIATVQLVTLRQAPSSISSISP